MPDVSNGFTVKRKKQINEDISAGIDKALEKDPGSKDVPVD